MKSRDITTLRQINQQLIDSSFNNAADLVKWMGAVQSQDYAGAKWALANRLQKPKESEIDEALDSGKILRTHVLRPTWHYVSPEDIRWMVKLSEPRISAFGAKYFRDLKLDKKTLTKSNAIIEKALHGGKHLTKAAIGETLTRAGIDTNDLRLTFIIIRAELDRLICNGIREGKQITYGLLDARAPKARDLRHDEALEELATRYFKSRGPATSKDYTWWSGLGPADVKRSMDIVAPLFDKIEVDGQRYFFKSSGEIKKKSNVHLLPAWDEYTVAYKDRSLVIDPAFIAKAGNGIFNPNIVANGQMIGTWRRTLKGKMVSVELHYFRPPGEAVHKKIASAATRYAAFVDKKLELIVKKK